MAEREVIYEPERHFRDAALDLECHIFGHAPVQAEGRLADCPLYFRARWSGWRFTISTNVDIDPASLTEGDSPGFFANGEICGWAQWGDYGSGTDASYMPYTMAEQIIRECAAAYLAECSG